MRRTFLSREKDDGAVKGVFNVRPSGSFSISLLNMRCQDRPKPRIFTAYLAPVNAAWSRLLQSSRIRLGKKFRTLETFIHFNDTGKSCCHLWHQTSSDNRRPESFARSKAASSIQHSMIREYYDRQNVHTPFKKKHIDRGSLSLYWQ